MILGFQVLTILVAIFHLGFLVLEMFLWTTPIGLKIFHMTEMQAQMTKVLAQNQGLYNGLFAAGIIYAFLTGDFDLVVVFHIFIVIAGIFGAVTASPTIFFVQALPAMIALTLRFLV